MVASSQTVAAIGYISTIIGILVGYWGLDQSFNSVLTTALITGGIGVAAAPWIIPYL